MEVVENFETNEIIIAKVKGHPDDLAWYEEGKNPSERVIIWDGKDYYEIQYSKSYNELIEMYKNNKEDFLLF